jgi:isochorismate hydrolase
MAEKPAEKAEKAAALPRSPELMNREDSALLVIDVQTKLFHLIPQRARIAWNIRRLLDAAAALGIPAAATEQYPDKLGPTVPELNDRIGHAHAKRCFTATECSEIFDRWRAESRSRVLLCGIEAHVCVLQTALDLVVSRRMWPWMRLVRAMRSIMRRRYVGWSRSASFSPRPRPRCLNGAERRTGRNSKRLARWRKSRPHNSPRIANFLHL